MTICNCILFFEDVLNKLCTLFISMRVHFINDLRLKWIQCCKQSGCVIFYRQMSIIIEIITIITSEVDPSVMHRKSQMQAIPIARCKRVCSEAHQTRGYPLRKLGFGGNRSLTPAERACNFVQAWSRLADLRHLCGLTSTIFFSFLIHASVYLVNLVCPWAVTSISKWFKWRLACVWTYFNNRGSSFRVNTLMHWF